MRPSVLPATLFVVVALLSAAAAGQPPASAAPTVAAASYLLLDTLSGQTRVVVCSDERPDPASLTKLMTAYLVFGAFRARTIVPSQMVNVSQKAWRVEGSRMFIEPRKIVSVDEPLREEFQMQTFRGNPTAWSCHRIMMLFTGLHDRHWTN